MVRDRWETGDAYEAYVGRWSRIVAREFVRALGVPRGRRWLDVGCGTGALTAAVGGCEPTLVVGVDRSLGFLRAGPPAGGEPRRADRGGPQDAGAHEPEDPGGPEPEDPGGPEPQAPGGHGLRVAGDARALPFPDASFDAVVSGLALNFVPDPPAAAAELARVAAPGGTVAAYVWDYADGMAMMRHLWDAAAAVDPGAGDLDEARRFAMCRPGPLRTLWTDAGLNDVRSWPIEIPTLFADFAAYWEPFLGGQGPAPAYVMSLPQRTRDALRDRVRAGLPTAPDGSIALTARAWAVSGSAAPASPPRRRRPG